MVGMGINEAHIIEVALYTIVPRSPLFVICFLYSKILPVTKIIENAVGCLLQ